MLPSIHKSQPLFKEKDSLNSQQPSVHKHFQHYKAKHSKKIWLDTKPAETNEEIYTSCHARIVEMEKRLHALQVDYRIDREHIHDTMKTHSFHLARLKEAMGLHELKSAQTISDVIKIVEHTMRVERFNRAVALEAEEAEKIKHDALAKFQEVVSEAMSLNSTPKTSTDSTNTETETKTCANNTIKAPKQAVATTESDASQTRVMQKKQFKCCQCIRICIGNA